jgi:hypothetical protein
LDGFFVDFLRFRFNFRRDMWMPIVSVHTPSSAWRAAMRIFLSEPQVVWHAD